MVGENRRNRIATIRRLPSLQRVPGERMNFQHNSNLLSDLLVHSDADNLISNRRVIKSGDGDVDYK